MKTFYEFVENLNNDFDLNHWFKVTKKINGFFYPKIFCNDGFSMSVQASPTHYSTKKQDNDSEYAEVEVGFPSENEPDLLPYKEQGTNDTPHTESVYPYVPTEIVEKIIKKHGGIK